MVYWLLWKILPTPQDCWLPSGPKKKMHVQDISITTQELNKFDNICTKLELRAEKCRKLKTGEVPYAPENVQKYGKEIRLWSMVIAKKSGKHVSTWLLAQRPYEIGSNEYMRQPIEEMKLRASTWKKYNIAKPIAREKRSEFLQKRSELQDKEGHKNLAKKYEK